MKRRNLMILLLCVLLVVATAVCACNKDKDKMFTISFNMGEGAEEMASVSQKSGSTYDLPNPPTRENFVFEGWYLEEDLSGEPVSQVEVNGDMTVYAKWSPAVALTLQLPSGNKTIYVKAGALLKPLLDAEQPEAPADHIFGAWFIGDSEMAQDMTMPSDPITIEARFKVHFTAQVYLLQDNGSPTRSDDQEGYGYAGNMPQIKVGGYRILTSQAGTNYKTLSDDASQNNFVVYMTTEGFTVIANPNCPAKDNGLEDFFKQNVSSKTPVTDLPVYDMIDNYIFLGWSRDRNASVPEWKSSYVYDNLYNKSDDQKADPYKIEEDNVILYGVWLQGAEDIFGGNDLVFLTKDSTPSLFVWRGGKLFEGQYSSVNGEFIVKGSDDKTQIRGKLNGNGKFSYSNSDRQTLGNYFLYTLGSMDSKVTLVADKYDGITYTDQNLDSDRVSNGTYVLDEDGNYVVTFGKGGPMSERTVTIMTAQLTTGQRVFVVRNDSDLELGTVYRLIGNDGSLYYPSFTFDGFFTATYNTGTSQGNYYYTRASEDEIWIGQSMQSFESSHDVLKLSQTSLGGQTVYAYSFYYGDLDHEFKSATDGSTLVLDGQSTATFGGKQYMFMMVGTAYASENSGTLIGLYTTSNSGRTLYALLNVYSTHHTVGEGEDAETVYEYFYRTLDKNYAELFRLDSQTGTITNDLLLVMESETKASIYAVSNSIFGLFISDKLVEGTLEFPGEQSTYNNTYVFNIDKIDLDEEAENRDSLLASGLGYNFDAIDYFEFGMASSSGRQLFYYVAYKLNDANEEVRLDHVYTSDKNSDRLTIIGMEDAGFATYSTGGEVYSGNYEVQDFIFILTYADASEAHTLYLQLNEEDGTFTELSLPLGRFIEYSNGTTNRDNYLTFDGKGGATLHEGETEIVGKFEESKDYTMFEDLEIHYMTFTSNDNVTVFKYVFMRTSNYTCFVRFNDALDGVYDQVAPEGGEELERVAKLELDGYYIARYTLDVGNPDETILVPYTYNAADNSITLTLATQSGTFYAYFDLKGGNKFTERGSEYTEVCLWYDNSRLKTDLVFALDGYGNLKVYDGNDFDDEERVPVGSGTYEFDENGKVTFTYKLTADGDSAPAKTLNGSLGTVTLSGATFMALLVEHTDSVDGTYVVTDDYTVLYLDKFGNAAFVNNMGMAYRAMYQVVDPEMANGKKLIFFTGVDTGSSNTSKEAGLFILDEATETVTPVKYDKTYSYYTSDLESLLFSTTGCVYIGAELAFFVVTDENTHAVTIYRSSNESGANSYGFVKDTSLTLTQTTKTFGGKEYKYNAEEGYNIHFTRTGSTNEYPLSYIKENNVEAKNPISELRFTPSYNSTDSTDFSVSGTVKFAGDEESYRCTVIRRGTETYISISDGSLGYYRFDISVTYNGGTGNTFTISSMKHIVELNAYEYEYIYWMMYFMGGPLYADQVQNTYGSMKIETVYTTAGEIETDKFYGNIVDMTLYVDDLGQAFTFDESGNAYETAKLSLGFYSIPSYAVTVTGTDGYTYKVYFAPQSVSIMTGMSVSVGYLAAMITRVQEMTFESGSGECKLAIETIMYGNESLAMYGIAPGGVYSWKITYGEEEYVPAYSYVSDETTNEVTYIVRITEEDSDTVISAKYFKFNLKEDEISETSKYQVAMYDKDQSSFVGVDDYTVMYSQDGKQWVDYNEETHKVGLFCFNNRTVIIASSSTYDANSKTFDVAVKLRDNTEQHFKIEIKRDDLLQKDYIVITEVETE